MVNVFNFQCFKEAFRNSIIPAISFTAHASFHKFVG